MERQEEKIRLLLSMQEHPEDFTNNEIEQLLEDPEMDELLRQLSLAKHALTQKDTKTEDINVETHWAKFSHSHKHGSVRRVAAIMTGAVCMAGLVLATAHWTGFTKPTVQSTQQATTAPVLPKTDTTVKQTTVVPSDTSKVVFDNVNLETMLQRMAKHYGVSVNFKNERARNLRFYFEWNEMESLDETVRRLNLFDSFSIKTDNHQIIVK